MKGKEGEVFKWAVNQAELITKKFSDKENTGVLFGDFEGYVVGACYNLPESTDSNKGGDLVITDRGDKYIVIDYHMYKGAVLDIHHHPDAVENFNIHVGSMVNECSNIEYHAGAVFDMLPYEPHQFRCTEDCHATITLRKV